MFLYTEHRGSLLPLLADPSRLSSRRVISSENYRIFSGGGGAGRGGIPNPNALLLAHYDSAANTLSDQSIQFQMARHGKVKLNEANAHGSIKDIVSVLMESFLYLLGVRACKGLGCIIIKSCNSFVNGELLPQQT